MKRPILSVLALLLALATGCEARPQPAAATSGGTFDHSHAAWTRLLEAHVHKGQVDYTALQRDPSALQAYLDRLASVRPEQYDGWSEAERLAYWINAYNAWTVKLVLENWPVKSIKHIGGLLRSPFKIRFVPLEGLRGKTLSLDDIEHAILRQEFQEPRIHFAIVCASKGCPPLAAQAYRAQELESQLATQTHLFLGSAERNRYDAAVSTLYLSPLFKWFRGDFEAAEGSLVAFVRRHGPPATGPAPGAEVRVRFLDYDWSLNGR